MVGSLFLFVRYSPRRVPIWSLKSPVKIISITFTFFSFTLSVIVLNNSLKLLLCGKCPHKNNIFLLEEYNTINGLSSFCDKFIPNIFLNLYSS